MKPEDEKKAFEAFMKLISLTAKASNKSPMEIIEEMHYRNLEREEAERQKQEIKNSESTQPE